MKQLRPPIRCSGPERLTAALLATLLAVGLFWVLACDRGRLAWATCPSAASAAIASTKRAAQENHLQRRLLFRRSDLACVLMTKALMCRLRAVHRCEQLPRAPFAVPAQYRATLGINSDVCLQHVRHSVSDPAHPYIGHVFLPLSCFT